MSDTIHPDEPVQAIVSAATPRDILRAATADPELANALTGLLTADDPKSLLASRTFWAAILAPVISGLAARYAAGLDVATVGAITTLTTTLAMIAMRIVTRGVVTSVLPVGK